jgi:PAS domain S-box-containing protein
MEEVLALNMNGVVGNHMGAQPHVSWPAMPRGEADLLSVRRTYSEFTSEILARARKHYQNEKRLRALLENSFDAISLTDEYGNIVYASASTARVLGYQPQELVGQNEFEWIHPDDLQHVKQIFAEILSKPHFPIQLQFRARHKDGHWCWIERTSTNLLEEPELNAIVSNYRDISERKMAEDEKQRRSEELFRTNQELQSFAYAAAHDLKEPLRTISACTQLLSRNAQLDDNGRKLAAFVVESAKRMSVLLDDLLSFAGLTSDVQLEQVELAQALRQAIKNLEELINESSATITFGELPTIHGNKSHLAELFQNLISNSIKYRSDAAVQIDITAVKKEHEWVIRVRDNGIGIAPEYHQFVFGLLKRLHGRDVPGTGIGLAICKKIVTGMGGRIWVESEPQKGSTFCFTVTE